jgi:hypothetical protein
VFTYYHGNPEHVVVYTNHGIDLFYLAGVYIPSGNAEHVVIYTNHGIYQFYLVGVYIPSGNPEHVVVYTNHGIYLFYLQVFTYYQEMQNMLWFIQIIVFISFIL